MSLINLLLLIVLASCASNSNAWYEVAPAFEKQKWRMCIKEKDGEEKHLNGMCYIAKECRKRFLRSKICRPLPLYCPYTDKTCLSRHAYSNKYFMRKRR